MPILLKLFQTFEETFPETIHETTVTLIPKPDKDTNKSHYDKPTAINDTQGEKLKANPLKLEQEKDAHSHHFYST